MLGGVASHYAFATWTAFSRPMSDDVGLLCVHKSDHGGFRGRQHDEALVLLPFGIQLPSVGWGSAVCMAWDCLLGASLHRHDPAVGPPLLQWFPANSRNAEHTSVGANLVLDRPHVGAPTDKPSLQ